jgi:hypothetical protein
MPVVKPAKTVILQARCVGNRDTIVRQGSIEESQISWEEWSLSFTIHFSDNES